MDSAGGTKRESDSGESDHEAVVGKVGIGLLGLAEVPVGTNPGGSRSVDTVLTAPILGARYWLSERFGLEAGVGFMFRSGNVSDSVGNKGDVSSRAFALQAGLPIALVWGKHYNVIAIPYLGMGFSKARDTRGDATPPTTCSATACCSRQACGQVSKSSWAGLGSRASRCSSPVVCACRIEKTSANIPILNDDASAPPESYDVDSTSVVFATSQGSTLGSSIAGCIAAVYYF